MDHLWLDEQAQKAPDQVPVLGQVIYDVTSGDYFSFLEDQGYDGDDLADVIFESFAEKPRDRKDFEEERRLALSTFQEWLFFGLLIEFARCFGVKVKREELMRTHGGTCCASTSNLVNIVERIAKVHASSVLRSDHPDIHTLFRAEHLPIEEISQDKQITVEQALFVYIDTLSPVERVLLTYDIEPEPHIIKQRQYLSDLLETVCNFLESFAEKRDYDAAQEDTKLMWLSAAIMAETLGHIGKLLFGARTDSFVKASVAFGNCDSFWVERSALCYFRLSRSRITTIGESYVASLASREVKADHSLCSESGCKALSAINKVKLPFHQPACTEMCTMVGLDGESDSRIKEILTDGSIPVLRVTKGHKRNYASSIKVFDKAHAKPYVAISHVWAQGLGNPNANALPQCQLQSLQRLLQSDESTPMTFWIDTLCVPLVEPYRKQAIRKMKETYEAATKVLVIDQDMLRAGRHEYLRLQSVALSDWMTRLWTLQEGILGDRNLCIAFSDGIYPLYEMTIDGLLNRSIKDRLLSGHLYTAILADFAYDRSQPDRLMGLASTLHRRTTSKREDEAICLATLLSIDVKDLPSNPSLLHVLKCMATLPQEILFTPGPRSEQTGFRWSPQSLLNQVAKSYRPFQQVTSLDTRGIKVCTGITILQNPLFIQSADPVTDHLIPFIVSVKGYHSSFFVVDYDMSSLSSSSDPFCFAIEKAALVHQKPDSDGTGVSQAVLVSNLREVNGELYGHYDSLVDISDGEFFHEWDNSPMDEMFHVDGVFETRSIYVD